MNQPRHHAGPHTPAGAAAPRASLSGDGPGGLRPCPSAHLARSSVTDLADSDPASARLATPFGPALAGGRN
jgi:hypothetical protein